MIRLNRSVDTGYSGWTQFDDGTVVITDYTNDAFRGYDADASGRPTLIKSYRIRPESIPS